jgi:rRNA maturation endonuclease Nob1
MNKHSPVVLVVPMTTTKRISGPFEIPYKIEDLILIKKNIAKLKELGHSFDEESEGATLLCQQSRSISKERLIIKVGSFKLDTYAKKIKDAISFLYAIHGCIKCHEPMRKNSLKCRQCGTVHNEKCSDCRKVLNFNYRFCPYCGKEARK